MTDHSSSLAPSSSEVLGHSLRGLKHGQPSQRVKAIRALSKMQHLGYEAFQPLAQAVNDPDQNVREAAVQGMSAFGAEALPDLVNLLNHSCKYVRRNVVWSIGKLGSGAVPAVRALCEVLKDVDPRTASGAAQALGAIGRDAADAVPALMEAMRGANVVLCRLASKALSQIGAPALPVLVQHLAHHDPFVRGEAAVSLGWMGSKAVSAVPALNQLLTTWRAPMPASVPWNSASEANPTPLAAVEPCEGSAEDVSLLHVIQALGKMGANASLALPTLKRIGKTGTGALRDAANESLAAINKELSKLD